MNKITKTSIIVFSLLLIYSFSQPPDIVPDMNFTDMKGKSYNLYTILGQGKYVYFMLVNES